MRSTPGAAGRVVRPVPATSAGRAAAGLRPGADHVVVGRRVAGGGGLRLGVALDLLDGVGLLGGCRAAAVCRLVCHGRSFLGSTWAVRTIVVLGPENVVPRWQAWLSPRGVAMTDLMWVRSHVELLLQREWDVCRVLTDPDGDFPWRQGTAACWVSVLDSEPPLVRVFAHAAFGMKPSLRLLRELNDIEQRLSTARLVLDGDAVVVSQTVSAHCLTGPVLAQAMDAVAARPPISGRCSPPCSAARPRSPPPCSMPKGRRDCCATRPRRPAGSSPSGSRGPARGRPAARPSPRRPAVGAAAAAAAPNRAATTRRHR